MGRDATITEHRAHVSIRLARVLEHIVTVDRWWSGVCHWPVILVLNVDTCGSTSPRAAATPEENGAYEVSRFELELDVGGCKHLHLHTPEYACKVTLSMCVRARVRFGGAKGVSSRFTHRGRTIRGHVL